MKIFVEDCINLMLIQNSGSELKRLLKLRFDVQCVVRHNHDAISAKTVEILLLTC